MGAQRGQCAAKHLLLGALDVDLQEGAAHPGGSASSRRSVTPRASSARRSSVPPAQGRTLSPLQALVFRYPEDVRSPAPIRERRLGPRCPGGRGGLFAASSGSGSPGAVPALRSAVARTPRITSPMWSDGVEAVGPGSSSAREQSAEQLASRDVPGARAQRKRRRTEAERPTTPIVHARAQVAARGSGSLGSEVGDERWTATTGDHTQVTPDAIMQLGFGFWGSKTLLSAVELGLFTELAEAGPLDGEALRERLGLHRAQRHGLLRRARRAGHARARGRPLRATRPTPTCSSTAPSPPTSAACWRWPTPASTASGGR